MKILSNKYFVVVTLVVISVGNLVLLSTAVNHRGAATNPTVQRPPAEVVKPKLEITNEKEQQVSASERGKKLGTGSYKFDLLAKSRIYDSKAIGRLVLANHQASQAHFVLALGSEAKLSSTDVSKGWTLQPLNDDTLWLPGGCSSKPTQLLEGRYIFIDDGKTLATDKYNSYIFYDIQTNKFKYFGGNNFTNQQGNNETVLKVANENDEIAFYIDLKDDRKIGSKESDFDHLPGKEHGYIIRRVVDPETLKYTDYSLPYDVPSDVKRYSLSAGEGDGQPVVMDAVFNGSNLYVEYDSSVEDNSLTFTLRPEPKNNTDFTYDTALELKLDTKLVSRLPLLVGKPYKNSHYKTQFSIRELGSYNSIDFLIASGRNDKDFRETPVVYNSSDKTLSVMVAKGMEDTSYVPLGVY